MDDILSVLQELTSNREAQEAFALGRPGYLDQRFPGLPKRARDALLSGSRAEVLSVVGDVLTLVLGGDDPIHIMYPGFKAVFRATSPSIVPTNTTIVYRAFLTVGDDEAANASHIVERLKAAKGAAKEGVFLRKDDGPSVRCEPLRHELCEGSHELILYVAGEVPERGTWRMHFHDGQGVLVSPTPVQAVTWPPRP